MTVEETKKAIEELKEKGITYEQICDALYKMYRDDKLDLDQFEALAKLTGYELNEDFINVEKRRLEKSDLSYILGMKLSVTEEINLLKKIIKETKDEDVLEDLKEALYCLKYTFSDETIEYLFSIKGELIDGFYQIKGKS